jgi:hypothetical protein
MQATTPPSIRDGHIRPLLRLDLPDRHRERVEEALGHLCDLVVPDAGATTAQPSEVLTSDEERLRLAVSAEGWHIEGKDVSERELTEEAALLRLQSLLLESAARRQHWALFRGSVVARGSQSVLIAGDSGSCHTLLAVGMTALEFQFVSVGLTAFCMRRPAPIPVPLLFRLDTADRAALQLLPGRWEEPFEAVSADLFRPRALTLARELTHVLFPEARPGRLSMVRPLSPTEARSRLSQALVLAPDEPPPSVALSEVLRQARGARVIVGDPPQAIEQLARLLPRWCVE